MVGMIVDLAALDGRGPLIEQPAQGADQPGLTLAASPEQDDVVPGDQGALEVGQRGLPEPDDAGKGILPGPHHGEQILPYLSLDTAVYVPARAQFAESGDGGRLTAARGGVIPRTLARRGGACGACVVMLAVLLHHSTVCRDRTSLHLAQFSGRVPGPRMGGRLCSVTTTPGAVSSDDVAAARKLIHDVISDTPVLHSRVLSEAVAGPVFLKCEILQRNG